MRSKLTQLVRDRINKLTEVDWDRVYFGGDGKGQERIDAIVDECAIDLVKIVRAHQRRQRAAASKKGE